MRVAFLCLVVLRPWEWDAVTTNCKADLESAVAYVVTQVLVEPAGFRMDCAVDEDGEEVCVDNIVYWPPVFVREDSTRDTSFPQEDVYVPGPGGVTFIDVEAVDEAGNMSKPVCE